MGYSYIALGGMVPLKTAEILACLEAVKDVRRPETKLHLLGISRLELAVCFSKPLHEQRLSIDDFRICIDGKSSGAVRVSLGLVSNFEDVQAFLKFAEGLLR